MTGVINTDANGVIQTDANGVIQTVSSATAQFDVAIASTNSPVAPGDELGVTATVDNTGGAQGTQTITLDINNSVGQVDSTSVTLSGGGSTTQALSWVVPSGQTEQDYTATVASADDSASQTVTVGSAIPDSQDLYARWDVTEEGFNDGDAISTLSDQTGNGRPLSAIGSPTAKSNGFADMVARLDGSDDGFEWSLSSSLPQPYSLFFALKQNASSSFSELWRTRPTNNYLADTGESWALYLGGSSAASTSVSQDENPHIFENFAKSTDEVFIDGSQALSADVGGVSLQDTFYIGTDPSNSRHLALEFVEVLLYTGDKTPIRSDVFSYLNSRYGVV